MVSPRLRAAAFAVVCAVALSGCGGAHPGSAAQVGDVSIPDESLERSTTGFCEVIDVFNQAQQGTSPPVPMRSALLSALNALVMGEALDQLARRNGVEVTESEVRQWIGGLPLDFSRVPESRADEVNAVLERVGRNSLLADKLGRAVYEQQNPGGAPVPPDQVQRLGEQLVNDYMRRIDVQTDPRYGQALDPAQIPGTGSLSIPVSEEGLDGEGIPEPSSSLPKNRVCA
ncbi:MAG: SurA N-terminal domain-containing protein [Actinomycetota bacterium]|nr:SurA N-terminal domain-containing protein [Actinomycetota bacterium]